MNRDGFLRLDQGHGIVLVLLSAKQYVIAQTDEMSGEQGDSEQSKFTPAMSVVLIFFVSVFFLIAFISLYIRQRTRGRFSLADGTASFRRSRSVPSGGLDPAVVNTFPTFLYSDVNRHKIGQGTLECAVCLIEFQDQEDEILRLLPKCRHVFHLNCIDAWLAIHVTCPVCRANLALQPGQLGHLITLFHDSDYMTETYSPPRNGNSAQPDADLIIDLDPEEVIDIPRPSPNHKRPPTSTPTRPKLTGKIFRSHSTGHSVVQPGQNCERFTLRLPEEVRSQLVNSFGLKQSPQSGVVFPGESSSRIGYRSSSVGNNQGKACDNYDRVGRSAGWNFTRTPPFISRAGSSRSPSGSGGDDLMATQMMRSIKLPLDRLFFRGTDKDDGQERSTRWLIPEPDGHS